MCKQNTNKRLSNWLHHGYVQLWNPHADYLPVNLFLIIIHVYKLSSLGMGRRTSCIRNEQTVAAAAYRSGHEFIHEKKKPIHERTPASPPCLPWEQTFMKTFPQNRNNRIIIRSRNHLHHSYICCLANVAPSSPNPMQYYCNFIYPMDMCK